ncbi:hypothetical protein AB834_03470 [PVC group bacterium (ex Bugula neritina AB1)]|nr:hypothetical protein AB834_03470 [PVC group bacterium (ex Bugula neritina AB1)]
MKPCLLGLDFGEKRIGVAVSDALYLTAQPRGFILNSGIKSILEEIMTFFEMYGFCKIVLGLPLGLNDQETQQTQKVKSFKSQIEKNTSFEVVFHDESFTTKEAERILIQGGMSRKKRKNKIDAIAAQLMLQSYMDQNPL